MSLPQPPAVESVSRPADAVEVGRIVGPFGVKGWFRVQAFSADPQALFSTKRWFLGPPTGQAAASARLRGVSTTVPPLLKVTQAKEHGDTIVACAQEVPDRVAAEGLKGASVWVSRASFPTPAPDEYYCVDLLGLTVVNREGVELGAVTDFIETGPNMVIVCERPAEPGAAPASKPVQTLVPFVSAYVDTVSLAERRIVVDWALDG